MNSQNNLPPGCLASDVEQKGICEGCGTVDLEVDEDTGLCEVCNADYLQEEKEINEQ